MLQTAKAVIFRELTSGRECRPTALDRVQDGGDETRPQWIDNLFHESNESGNDL